MPTVRAVPLYEFTRRILAAAGTPSDIASTVSQMLVNANLCGVDSHGVMRIPDYVQYIDDGMVLPAARPRILRQKAATGVVDGNNGFGQLSGLLAMKVAIAKAKKYGVGTVTALRTNHLGRIADYTQLATESGMIGIAIVKGIPGAAPWGGRERLLGTSPMSFAIPAGKERPIVVDFATSISSEGKIRVKRWKKTRLPRGWILDKLGNPSTNPEDYYAGGAIQTFGTYKGYGLNLVAEALGGAMTGQGIAEEFRSFNGTFMQAISVEHFVPLSEFKKTVDRLIRKMRNSGPAKGFKEVLVPGDPEAREMERHTRKGIQINDQIWNSITEVAGRLSVERPKTL